MTEELLTIQLFGVFRDVEPSGLWRVKTTLPITAKVLKSLIENQYALKANSQKADLCGLLKSSALGTEKAILGDQDLIEKNVKLALLPPVCGG